ncbi:Breast carcinoma-amplified sequence 1, partial [Lamprotornis superbus]
PSHGSAARRALPAARPRSLLAVPWAVPGRAEGPAASPAPAEPSPGASGLSKAPAEGTEGHKAPLQDTQPTGTPEGRHAATPKDKPVTLLDRIFRLEKGKGGTRGDPEEGRQGLDVANGSIAASAPNGVLLGKATSHKSHFCIPLATRQAGTEQPLPPFLFQEIDECTQKELGQDSAGEEGPAAAAPGRAQVEQDSPQAAAGQGSVMSFLKTLVSPSKAEAKSDSEDKSPEQPPVTCVKADRNVPPSQEPPGKQNPKVPETTAPVQAVTTETPREATKDKGSATPLPLSKLFWKKNSSEEAEAVSNEKAEVALEAVAPDRDESKSAESTEVKPRGAESKTPKANLRKFFKLVRAAFPFGKWPFIFFLFYFFLPNIFMDLLNPSYSPLKITCLKPPQTLNATEKPLAPSDSDPGGQRSKEGSKDKKSTLELGKQKGREQPEPREGPAADPDSIHNGGDAKEPPYKKTEKRQSLGGAPKGCRMQKCRQTPCPSSLLGNPSSGQPWLLRGGSAALGELLAAEMTPFPSLGWQQTPEAEANTGASLQLVTGLFLTCRKQLWRSPRN